MLPKDTKGKVKTTNRIECAVIFYTKINQILVHFNLTVEAASSGYSSSQM